MKLKLSTDFKYEKSQRNRSLEIEQHDFTSSLVGYIIVAPVYRDSFFVTQVKDNSISVTPEISKKYEAVLHKGALLEVIGFDI